MANPIKPPASIGVKRGAGVIVVKGQRITAGLLNSLATPRGIGQGGPGANTLHEPAMAVPVNNGSLTVDIPYGAPVSLEEVIDDSDSGLHNDRSFKVVLLENASTANRLHAGIAVDFIPAGGAGEAFITGVCLARVTDDNAGLLALGGLTTLWEESSTGDRIAIVRFDAGRSNIQVKIIGGNALATGHQAIEYAADPFTPGATYDPDVDTVYTTGLGNAWLYINGERQADRVLVRHDFDGYTDPLLEGRLFSVRGSGSIAYGITSQTVYLISMP